MKILSADFLKIVAQKFYSRVLKEQSQSIDEYIDATLSLVCYKYDRDLDRQFLQEVVDKHKLKPFKLVNLYHEFSLYCSNVRFEAFDIKSMQEVACYLTKGQREQFKGFVANISDDPGLRLTSAQKKVFDLRLVQDSLYKEPDLLLSYIHFHIKSGSYLAHFYILFEATRRRRPGENFNMFKRGNSTALVMDYCEKLVSFCLNSQDGNFIKIWISAWLRRYVMKQDVKDILTSYTRAGFNTDYIRMAPLLLGRGDIANGEYVDLFYKVLDFPLELARGFIWQYIKYAEENRDLSKPLMDYLCSSKKINVTPARPSLAAQLLLKGTFLYSESHLFEYVTKILRWGSEYSYNYINRLMDRLTEVYSTGPVRDTVELYLLYLEKCFKNGMPQAARRLFKIYAAGKMIDLDIEKTIYWAQKYKEATDDSCSNSKAVA